MSLPGYLASFGMGVCFAAFIQTEEGKQFIREAKAALANLNEKSAENKEKEPTTATEADDGQNE